MKGVHRTESSGRETRHPSVADRTQPCASPGANRPWYRHTRQGLKGAQPIRASSGTRWFPSHGACVSGMGGNGTCLCVDPLVLIDSEMVYYRGRA
jgi:hypothetical protein